MSGDFHAGGGGAGGSLWIEAATFTGNGALRADGGDGGTSSDNAYGQGGGGAGGRVAVYASNHAFTSSGGTITIVGGSGYEDGEAGTVYISVTAPSPVTVAADFAATPISGNVPLTVTFTNLSASSDEVEGYQWDFGDGEASALENPVHTFTQTGNFTVMLTTTAGSESDVEIKTDYIAVSAPMRLELVMRTITYTYDGLYRLTGADYRSTGLTTGSSGEEFGYAYDAVGNMTAMTETMSTTIVTTYTHNAAYQLVTARTSNDGVTWYYIYDKRGNLTRQTPGSTVPVEGETRYTYDAAGNLARVEFYTAGDYTTLAEAAYNGAGERLRLTTWAAGVPVTVTYAVFDGQLLLSSDGSQNTLYSYGRRLIAEYGSEWVYPLRDRDGSARQIADRSGRVALARTYKPLGGILQEQGAYESVFGYLGAQLDRISGLLYAAGRYFDPATGRFLTPQRRVDAYRPRSLNPYAPWVDPTMLLLGPLMVWATLAAGERRRRYGRWTWMLLLLWVAVSVVGCGEEEDEDEATPSTAPTATVILVPPLIVTHPMETQIETPTGTMTLTVTPTGVATPTATEVLATLTCTPTPTNLPYDDADLDAVARMLYAEQRSEPEVFWHVAAWAIRNRVSRNYGGYGGYVGQLSVDEFELLPQEQVDALTGSNQELFSRIRTVAERVLNGTDTNPMIVAPNAIYFQNTYSRCQSDALEQLLDASDGNVGPGNWGAYERESINNLSFRIYYYTYQTPYPANYPIPPNCDYTPTPSPAP